MNRIAEQLDTAVRAEVDVLVCGGGPAGCAAALGAAQNGAKVMLVEYYGFLGGIPTAAGINGIGTWFHDRDGRVLIDGIPRKIITAAARKSGRSEPQLAELFTAKKECPDYRSAFGGHWINVNPEMLKIALDELMAEAGVVLLLQTQVVRPLMNGKCLKGVVVESKSGREAILAKVVIDATGDGDIAARAGAKYAAGRPEDGKCQPMSQLFLLGNANFPDLYYGFDDCDPEPDPLIRNRFREAVRQARRNGTIRENPNDILCAATPLYAADPLIRTVNFTRIQNCSATQADELSAAFLAGRRQVVEALNFIHRYVPGAGEAELLAIYPAIGVRESRRIIGDYVLSAEDIIAGKDFPDAIARGIYLLDLHNIDEVGAPSRLTRLEQPYSIPYRSLLPEGLDGILTAGRCISGDHLALSSYRIVSHCMATGEAAGTAAALSAAAGIPPRTLCPEQLRQTLAARGANPGPGGKDQGL